MSSLHQGGLVDAILLVLFHLYTVSKKFPATHKLILTDVNYLMEFN